MTASILRRIPLFSGFSDADLELVYSLASPHVYPRGTIIFFENDPADALHVVLEGTVRIYRITDDGREKTLAFVSDGEFFGEMALLDGEPRSAVAEALETTQTLAIYRSDFTHLLEQHPRISSAVIRVLSHRLRQTNAQLMDVVFRDARSRVISALVDLAKQHGAFTNSSVRIELKLTHQQLASLVGTARETISRILAELQDEGLVHVEGRRLAIPDWDALVRLTQ